ncbi:hypothetical protein CsSME_00030078 [Camellia sinensis var. sinensis]
MATKLCPCSFLVSTYISRFHLTKKCPLIFHRKVHSNGKFSNKRLKMELTISPTIICYTFQKVLLDHIRHVVLLLPQYYKQMCPNDVNMRDIHKDTSALYASSIANSTKHLLSRVTN